MKHTLLLLFLLPLTSLAQHADWMASLPDSAYVSEVSIPGSHDTATGHDFESVFMQAFSQTQTLHIDALLEAGVRAIDLRPRAVSGTLKCAHGTATLKLDFATALRTVLTFLDQHPTEFVIAHLLYATNYSDEAADYDQLLGALLQESDVASHLIDFRPDLTVADMRGRLLLLSRNDLPSCQGYRGGVFSGWPGDSEDWPTQKRASIEARYRGYDAKSQAKAVVQDISTYSSGKASVKTDAAVRLLDFMARPHELTARSQQVFALNFLSAYSGFVSASTSYASNAAIQNAAVRDYLASHTGPTGIVMMDYAAVDDAQPVSSAATVGLQTVEAIIAHNDTYLPRSHARTAPDGFEDVTHLLQNPHLEGGTGWKNTNAFTGTQQGVAEQYNKTFDTYQTIANAPAGTYRLTCQGFYRHGADATTHDNGTERLLAKLYLGVKSNAALLPSVYSSPATVYPNTLWEANVDLNVEQYYQADTLEYTLTAPKTLRLGVTKTATTTYDWTTFTNFQLWYRPLPDAIAAPRAPRPEAVYTLSGARVSRPTHGVYITGGRKVIR